MKLCWLPHSPARSSDTLVATHRQTWLTSQPVSPLAWRAIIRSSTATSEVALVVGRRLLRAEDLELYPLYVALAEGSLSETEFADWLRPHIKPDGARRVNERRARYAR